MLLKTIFEFKRYVAIDTLGIPPSIELELANTESAIIRPLLGGPLIAWLQQAYDQADFNLDGTDLAAQLVRAVQAPLARLAAATGITVHQASLDETGVHIMSTDTSKTAFQWQSNALQELHLRRGYNGLDELVEWLEENADASDELRTWAASPAGQRHRRELFTCTAEFQECENISNSRQVFQALSQVRRKLEAFEIGRVLGADYLFELREQVRTRTLTSENQMVLNTYVYPALAALTIAHAIPALGLSLNGDGIDLTIARIDDSNSKEADAGLDALLQQKASFALMDGERFLRRLTDHLDRSASETRYPTYFASSAYTAPAPAPIVNQAESRIFKLI
jgi:hypothetical protein